MKRKIIYIMFGILLLAPFAQAHALCSGEPSSMNLMKMQGEEEMDCHSQGAHDQSNKHEQNKASICDFTCAFGIGIPQTSLEQYSESKPKIRQFSKIIIGLHPAYSENLYRPPA